MRSVYRWPDFAVMFAAMITLSPDVETLARHVASIERTTVEDAIRRALEDRARAKGLVPGTRRRRRMTAEQPQAVGPKSRNAALRSALPPRNHGRCEFAMIVVDSSALVAILENDDFSATDVRVCALG